MKRLLLSAGTAMALLLPMAVQAQAPTACEGVRATQPISPYVKNVLARTQKGLDRLSGRSSGGFMIVFPGWIQSSLASVAGAVDVRSGSLGLRSNLLTTSTCLHLDTLHLECKLAEVREALKTQIQNQSPLGIYRAQSLIQYLQERLFALQEGAHDGTWLDATALNPQLFDVQRRRAADENADPACGNGILESGEECDDGNRADDDGCAATCLSEMCPYSSDYSEPIPSLGMGCDLYVLTEEDSGRGTATDVVAQETQVLEALLNARAELLPNADNPEHVSFEGCVRGWCANDNGTPCGKSADCGVGGQCVFGRRLCEADKSIRCSSDVDCGEDGPCAFVADTRHTTLRSPFSLEPDAFELTRQFVRLRERRDMLRRWPGQFRNPEDLPVAERARAERLDRGDPGRPGRLAARRDLRARQGEQGAREALLFATVADGHLRIAEELKPLREGVRKLGLMARETNGTRETARNLAYYILRTCIYRPCNEKLIQVLQMTFDEADVCFPYTNGEYLEQDAAAACADAIGVGL